MVYGQEEIMSMEYVFPSMRITKFTNMVEPDIMEERLVHLVTLEEDWFIYNFHQQVKKALEKGWNDRHIRHKMLKDE